MKLLQNVIMQLTHQETHQNAVFFKVRGSMAHSEVL